MIFTESDTIRIHIPESTNPYSQPSASRTSVQLLMVSPDPLLLSFSYVLSPELQLLRLRDDTQTLSSSAHVILIRQ